MDREAQRDRPAPLAPRRGPTTSAIHIIGDIHGQLEKLIALLREAALIDGDLAWTGAESRLWLIGDFVDRGPDGVGAIALAMRLQAEARRAGGRIEALLGNHDVLLLAAHRFGLAPSSGVGGSFLAEWQHNGGEHRDLERLTPEQIAWLSRLPAMARAGDDLLVHADAPLYALHGGSIAEVNAVLATLLASDDSTAWDRFLGEFGVHGAFQGEGGEARAAAFLRRFGGERIVHGHTPISSITGAAPETVRAPLVYAGGRCIDVDGGMYLGGPGFIFRQSAAR